MPTVLLRVGLNSIYLGRHNLAKVVTSLVFVPKKSINYFRFNKIATLAKIHQKPPQPLYHTPHTLPQLRVQQAARAWQRPVSSTPPERRAVRAGATARAWLEVRTKAALRKGSLALHVADIPSGRAGAILDSQRFTSGTRSNSSCT